MATKKKSAAVPAAEVTIDPEAYYDVTLTKSIKVGPQWLRPSDKRVRMLGSVLSAHVDAVSEYHLAPVVAAAAE